MGNGVVGEANALGIERPDKVLRGGEVAHGAIPKAPPRFNLTIGLGVVAIGRGASCAGDGDDGVEKFAQKFRGVVRVDDVW